MHRALTVILIFHLKVQRAIQRHSRLGSGGIQNVGSHLGHDADCAHAVAAGTLPATEQNNPIWAPDQTHTDVPACPPNGGSACVTSESISHSA